MAQKQGLADALTAEPSPEEVLLGEMQRVRDRVERKQREALIAAMMARISTLEEMNALLTALNGRKVQKPFKPAKRNRGDATAILVLSDWHVEERVDPKTVNGFNDYSLDIATARVERVFQKSLMLLEDSRHLTKINELVVAVLGDLISSRIHEELVETTQLAPLDAMLFAMNLLERGLRTLLAEAKVERIIVPTANGNHGRTTHKMRHATAAQNSYEHNAYLHLARRFQDEPRIHFQVGTGYHNWLNIQGHDVRFHHGDSMRYGGGVGGIHVPVNKSIAAWNKSRRAAVDFFGHFHQFTWNNRWVCNGSVIGYSAYALSIKAEYEEPKQTFAVIDQERGLTRVLPIFCE
jgi:hypothetical protein